MFSILNHIKPNGTLTSQTFWEWVLGAYSMFEYRQNLDTPINR